jgi:putative DNA primase/helicase
MNESASRQFLDLLYANTPQDQWISLFALDRREGVPMDTAKKVRWARLSETEDLVREASLLADTCCVWFGVSTRRTRLNFGRGGEDDCVVLPALFADIDIQGPGHKSAQLPPDEEEARKLLSQFSPPNILVHSGGGLQPYWVLDEPLPAAEARSVLDNWAYTWQEASKDYGWAIDNVFELARVLRLPGTFNRKRSLAEPLPVTVEFLDA